MKRLHVRELKARVQTLDLAQQREQEANRDLIRKEYNEVELGPTLPLGLKPGTRNHPNDKNIAAALIKRPYVGFCSLRRTMIDDPKKCPTRIRVTTSNPTCPTVVLTATLRSKA
jgi:hypothetical protein